MTTDAIDPDELSRPAQVVHFLNTISQERGVPYPLLVSAVEESMARAYEAHTGSTSAIARLDPDTGGIDLYERRTVVAVVTDTLTEIALAQVPGFQVGDFHDRKLEPGSFARIAGRTAHRIIRQRVSEFQREAAFQAWKACEGTLVTALVQRDVAGALYVLLDDRNEAAMPPWERNPRETHQINDRIVCELVQVRKRRFPDGSVLPVAIVSRASERFVRLLLDDPAVVAGARVPGRVTMLLVTHQVDVGAARAQIGDERIEQIPCYDDPLAVIRAALPRGIHLLETPDFDGVIVVSDDSRVDERARLVGKLMRRKVIAVRADGVDELLGDLHAQAAIGEPEPESAGVELDEATLRTKLEEFAREREANDRE